MQDRKAGHNPVFKAVLIYENFATGVRARCFCERLVRALDNTLEEQMWSFDVLGIREARNAAASAARKADVVIVSLLGRTDLPSTVRAWLDMWLWLLDKENPAHNDAWYGPITIRMEKGGLVITFDHTPTMIGDLQHWQHDTFKAHWRLRTIEDAFITFSLNPDGTIDSARMAAVSPLADFSFDFRTYC